MADNFEKLIFCFVALTFLVFAKTVELQTLLNPCPDAFPIFVK